MFRRVERSGVRCVSCPPGSLGSDRALVSRSAVLRAPAAGGRPSGALRALQRRYHSEIAHMPLHDVLSERTLVG